jgi:hypothetical protein
MPPVKLVRYFRSDDVAVAVPGHVDRAAGLLLERRNDVFRDLAHELVLHADHVPIVDLDPAEVGLGLAEGEVGRQRRGDAESREGAGALEEVATALGRLEITDHPASPDVCCGC